MPPLRMVVEAISRNRRQPGANRGHKRLDRKQENMKHAPNTNLITRSGFVLALALTIWFPVLARSAEPAGEMKMAEPKEMKCCQGMKDQRQKMMAEMKSQDAELTAQVAAMNSAPADKKLDLVAAIVTRLVEQRAAMNTRMEKMHAEMMRHMPMGGEEAPEHPMMRGMDEKPVEAQTGQK
jgi:hypothetical protein